MAGLGDLSRISVQSASQVVPEESTTPATTYSAPSLSSSHILPPDGTERGNLSGNTGSAVPSIPGTNQLLDQKIFPGIVHVRAQRVGRSSVDGDSVE